MLRRGAIAAVVVLLLAGTSSYNRVPSAPVIAAPTMALAAETDRRDNPPRRPRLPILGELAPAPRILLGATTTQNVVALTFDLDMNAGMAAAARGGAVWINKDALSYLETRNIHATVFMTGMWAEVYPALARQVATNPNFEIGDHSYSHPAFHLPCYRLHGVRRAGGGGGPARFSSRSRRSSVRPESCRNTSAFPAVAMTARRSTWSTP